MNPRALDFAGVGIGPANLSLAALSVPHTSLHGQFFEKAERFRWHPDFLFPESMMQTSFLKDLVTPVDPTSRYSFLSFLVARKRFYHFLNAGFAQVTRTEFAQYLTWVAEALPNVTFNAPIDAITWNHEQFELHGGGRTIAARNIVLGTGRTPHVPDCARPHLGPTVFHTAHLAKHGPEVAGRRVAVIGGGQSGAELVNHLLLEGSKLPSRLLWTSRRSNFLPLDDSLFANEWFTPEYSCHFFGSDPRYRARLIEEQTLASDGISMSLLAQIYQRLYFLERVEERPQRLTRLLPDHELMDIERGEDGWGLRPVSADGHAHREVVDLVLLATGYEHAFPACLEPLRRRIAIRDGELEIRGDYSIEWDGPANRRIYVQNGARRQRGVADPNLSVVAWRSAVILNSLAGRRLYDDTLPPAMVDWRDRGE